MAAIQAQSHGINRSIMLDSPVELQSWPEYFPCTRITDDVEKNIVLIICGAPQKKARESKGMNEAGTQEAPTTPVPSDARLASMAEALQRQKDSHQQADKVLTLMYHISLWSGPYMSVCSLSKP